MKHHWWRIFVSGILGLLTLVSLTAYFMRDNLFRELIEPAVPFQVDEPPPPPDYSDAAAWASRPQETRTMPRQTALRPANFGKADVFLIHPTTAWSGNTGWNMDISDTSSRTRLETIGLPNHGEPFASAGPLWVPRYRQAVLFALLSQRDDSHEALDLAYQDVARAFDTFRQARNPARPFVLVGIGQGGLHLLRLLLEKGDLGPKLAATYFIDQAVPTSLYQGSAAQTSFPKPCQNAQQTRCMLAFIELDGGDDWGEKIIKQRSTIWTPETGYRALNGQAIACVNPLTGSINRPNAPAISNRGSAAASGLERGTEPALLPAETGAICRRNLLWVEVNRPAALTKPRFELGTFYKITGYNLFYAALAGDVKTRVDAMDSLNTRPAPIKPDVP
ncbi:DUF3089 domain-containing protein [Candidatus Phycosocius spiralis]|uniref:DUF3089 domain-containing protein n=1 Tax=Candidatus Phycosocius spiralis TaxID=2815099 RepID=A0ABQ4PXW7_9PROT|nr:DUF3089 domain-containing protein [Candidatus Phycosocius spiralis]GIU67877.1 hypothetical protein PsB1_2031 [Candidatus Phycosocius spiralis]